MIEHAPVPIVRIGNPILTQKARSVARDLRSTEAFQGLLRVMKATLKGNGVGLAAPQVGVPLRVFVMEDLEEWVEKDKLKNDKERVPLPFTVVINPTWMKISDEERTFFEGCLSIPGLQGSVPRFRSIRARWISPMGEVVEQELHGWQARIFQHESDHLEGKLYLEYLRERPSVSYPKTNDREGVDDALLRALGFA
jgi:peptide deformylase